MPVLKFLLGQRGEVARLQGGRLLELLPVQLHVGEGLVRLAEILRSLRHRILETFSFELRCEVVDLGF